MINFIASLIGTLVIIATGVVIGFWIEILSTKDLPNGFYECKDCGSTFVETERFFKKK
jgi:hypothetical protein